MRLVVDSPAIPTSYSPNKQPIHVVYQYFVHSSTERHNEIKTTLKKLTENPLVNTIHLLNERIYTTDELGISNEKIRQYDVKDRLTFKMVFDFIDTLPECYVCIINSDIFFDKTLTSLYRSGLSEHKSIISLLRYEYTTPQLNKCKLFGPRPDSQDTWILHTKFNIPVEQRKVFNFHFGKPGCDNSILYILQIIGYQVYNDPAKLRTYHIHSTQIRNYDIRDLILPPHYFINPYGIKDIPLLPHIPAEKNIFYDNRRLYDHILKTSHFLVPRIAGVENNVAFYSIAIKQNPGILSTPQFSGVLNSSFRTMKSNAGIKLDGPDDLFRYGQLYLAAFQKATAYLYWESRGDVYRYISQSHDFITSNFSKVPKFWAFSMDIFHYIHDKTPWTHALKGKRLLIISPFVESMQEKLPVLDKIYDRDLFPECSFVFLKPPQTQADTSSRSFHEELNDFDKEIDTIKDTFDVALVSCGGYGNLVCSSIFDMGKSAIYVGGVLQMYFGILGNRWIEERNAVVNIFVNDYWTRPKDREKPSGFQKIERGCYW
jgi:hypothetical protein